MPRLRGPGFPGIYHRVIRSVLPVLAVVAALAWPGSTGSLEIHFIDVGQGSAVLLRTADAAVLVDAGEQGETAAYLAQLGVHRLDLAVATHAHADHIGGFPAVFRQAAVERLWYNGQNHTTRTFSRFLDAVLDSDAVYHEPSRGEQAHFGELTITVLHPRHSAAEYTGPLHDMNIVLRADWRESAVILTGDAEIPVEHELRAAGVPLEAPVLLLGHHGSRTSSSREFLDAVHPQIVVYQAGRDNRYGHPHREVISRVRQIPGVRVYGTDVHGTIVIDFRTGAPRVTTGFAARGAIAGCIDLNTASPDDLRRIVHIGTARAQEIIALRPLRSLDDLRQIPGIASGRIQDIRNQGLVCPLREDAP